MIAEKKKKFRGLFFVFFVVFGNIKLKIEIFANFVV